MDSCSPCTQRAIFLNSNYGEPDTHDNPLITLKGRRVYIESYGCTFNLADSHLLKDVLRQNGCTIVSEEDAESVIINTCTVVSRTERRILHRLRKFSNRDLYVMGCMPVVQMEQIASVCSPKVIPSNLVRDYAGTPGTILSGVVGIVQIATGCLGKCTYCITRPARGPLKSTPIPAITSAVQSLVKKGAIEIQLTGQDVSAWGVEDDTSLPTLLRELISIPEWYYIRLGMMNPATLAPILDEVPHLLKNEKFFKFIHLPIQSGSDHILTAMGRGHTRELVSRIIKRIRDEIPNVWLSTDIIVGFPGESNLDFEQTIDLIESIKPNKINITRFSKRPSTPAWDMVDFPDRIKKDRSRILTSLSNRIYRENNKVWIGRESSAIAVEQLRAGTTICRTPEYRSVVVKNEIPLGKEVEIVIEEDHLHYFTGSQLIS